MTSGSNKFPVKLYNILQEAEKTPYLADIVSWLPDGKAFKVHKKDEFSKAILPTSFGTNVFKSFQRNLHFWGFSNIRKGPSKGVCSHPNFVRDQPELLSRMRRVRAPSKNNGSEHGSHEEGHATERAASGDTSPAASLRRTVPAYVYAAAGLDPTQRVVSPSASSSQSSAAAVGLPGNSGAAASGVDTNSAALLLLLQQQQAQQKPQASTEEQQNNSLVESLLLRHLIAQQEQQQQQKRIQELLAVSLGQPAGGASQGADQSALVGLLASQLLQQPQHQQGNTNVLASLLR
eukprot:CAMPEP_0176103184 /NCGR_PEP_ID=MMETSP0120_2-20121206/51765_1 /TAXON_ID=160619 /ORGANISM="Kryptoperidinium foliaceum, Strain CCMP 1326" /LENGTH=290 /DNA_ID=CAMNT_0017437263 /DNA_START=74 /DNA_END=946 /DNA_ORIENTATION=-